MAQKFSDQEGHGHREQEMSCPDDNASRSEEGMMSQNAVKRLYLMQVGSVPEYRIPIVCYLVQTGDGKNILIDSGLPEIIPEGESGFENGRDVIEQLASIGLQPDDIETVMRDAL